MTDPFAEFPLNSACPGVAGLKVSSMLSFPPPSNRRPASHPSLARRFLAPLPRRPTPPQPPPPPPARPRRWCAAARRGCCWSRCCSTTAPSTSPPSSAKTSGRATRAPGVGRMDLRARAGWMDSDLRARAGSGAVCWVGVGGRAAGGGGGGGWRACWEGM